MKIIKQNDKNIAVINKQNKINNKNDILDLLADAYYLHNANAIIVYQESLHEDFFNLKTGFAGEILQKFSNSQVRLAIIGDFSLYNSKSLNSFITECNRGNLVYFTKDLNEAITSLS